MPRGIVGIASRNLVDATSRDPRTRSQRRPTPGQLTVGQLTVGRLTVVTICFARKRGDPFENCGPGHREFGPIRSRIRHSPAQEPVGEALASNTAISDAVLNRLGAGGVGVRVRACALEDKYATADALAPIPWGTGGSRVRRRDERRRWRTNRFRWKQRLNGGRWWCFRQQQQWSES